MGALERLLEANRRGPRPEGQGGTVRLCVVTCDDPSLTGRLEPALGIAPGEAVVIRLPGGGTGVPLETLEKAVAKAVYLHDCDEVVLLSHRGCRLTAVTADQVLEALGRWQVPRSAVPFDIRDLVGAGREPQAALRGLADALRRCAFLPEALLIHLCALDEADWSLAVLEHGQGAKVARASAIETPGFSPGPVALVEPSLPSTLVPQVAIPDATPIEVALPQQTIALEAAAPVQVEESAPAPSRAQQRRRTAPPPLRPGPAAAENDAASPGRAEATESAQARRAARRADVVQSQQALAAGRRNEVRALDPRLADAVEKLRLFVSSELQRNERRELAAKLNAAHAEGASGEELAKLLLKPILGLGSARYKVFDEMLALKEAMQQMPGPQAHGLTREIVG